MNLEIHWEIHLNKHWEINKRRDLCHLFIWSDLFSASLSCIRMTLHWERRKLTPGNVPTQQITTCHASAIDRSLTSSWVLFEGYFGRQISIRLAVYMLIFDIIFLNKHLQSFQTNKNISCINRFQLKIFQPNVPFSFHNYLKQMWLFQDQQHPLFWQVWK